MAKCPICGKRFAYSFAKANDGTQVCSEECITSYNKIQLANGNTGNKSSSSNQSSVSNSSNTAAGSGGFFSSEPEKETNEHDVAIEQEYTKREIERSKISLEKEKLKAEKAKQLRAEGKNVQAFILLHPYLIVGSVVLILLISLFSYSRYVHGAHGREQEAAIELNAELEKTEMELITGINNKKPSNELLELVTKLQHNNINDFIDGKKYGIIKSDGMSKSGPDDLFFGTYSEYWSGMREAYKEIITKGISIDDYLIEINKEKGNSIPKEQTSQENKSNENAPTSSNAIENEDSETTEDDVTTE